MKRRLTFILIALIVIISEPVCSQGIRVLDFPDDFIDPNLPVVGTLDEYPISHGDGSFASLWEVYSDRDNNTTYSTAQGSQPFRTVGFLDKFYVTEESNDYVHIFKDNQINYSDEYLSDSAEDFGWISKNNLILYKACLKNQKKVNQKGMLINTKETIHNAVTRRGERSILVRFYTEPGLNKEADFQSTLYQIYFIYKKIGNAVLLGTGPRAKWGIENEGIVGWAPFDRITNWSHRIAFEPNWETDAWSEREKTDVKASVFFSKKACENFISNPINYNPGSDENSQPLWNADPISKMTENQYKREIGEWRRFPVLNEVDENCYLIGTVGDISTSYEETVSSSDDAVVRQRFEKGLQSIRQKNILFVIDGTQSMAPYFKSVSQAVAKSIENISLKDNSSQPPRFGCVVYRDLAYKLTEKKDFNENYTDIINFLNNIKAGDFNDPDHAEAVNYGLDEALRMLPDGETNFVVLIGDAGSHKRSDRSFVSKQQIERMIAIKQPHFLAFQVSNRSNEGYETFKDFANDAYDILLGASATIRDNYKLSVEYQGNPDFEMEKDTEEFFYSKLVNSPIIGNVLECKPGKRFTPEKLQEEIVKLVNFSGVMISNLEKKIAAVGSGKKLVPDNSSKESGEYSQYVDNYNGIRLNFFNNLGLTDEEAKYISQDRFQYYQKGYAAYKVNGLNYPLFKPVVLMDRLELSKLIVLFSGLGDVINDSPAERRQKFYETWLQLLSSHLGENNIERLANMSLEEVADILYGTGGLPLASNMLKKNISCLTDPACTDEREFNKFLQDLYNSSQTLNLIFNSDDESRIFMSSGFAYYWLDFDILP